MRKNSRDIATRIPVILLFVLSLIFAFSGATLADEKAPTPTPIPTPVPKPLTSYSELLDFVENESEKIEYAVIVNGGNRLEIKLKDGGQLEVAVPESELNGKLADTLLSKGVQVRARQLPVAPPPSPSIFWTFGPVLLLVGAMILISGVFRRGGGLHQTFTRSRAKALDKSSADFRSVSFGDIAGCDEAVREVQRVVKGLVEADVYKHFKAKRPKGILLIGPPGTGKTLLARAVATACDGTMDIVSGSEFVEMYVGVGAARVRDMNARGIANARKTGKPHIFFIDEIDAIGTKRSGGAAGGNRNDEREGTLNQILVSMDGLASSEDIIWIAATNRPEILDEALLRPGRFDCQVYVDLPDKSGREKIFAIHSRSMPLSREVDFGKLAGRSYGYSGAEIELVCNRAAILAAERWAANNAEKLKQASDSTAELDGSWQKTPQPVVYGFSMGGFVTTYVPQPTAEDKRKSLADFVHAACKDDPTAVITLADFDEAIDFVRFGDARVSRQTGMAQGEKLNTAVHEAGHAVVAELMPGADPVAKVTIMGRSRALGYVQQIPENDRYSITSQQLVARMVVSMAGRAAQEEVLGTCDSGAQNDFEQACDIAWRMVCEWGMSRLGHIAVGGRTSMSNRGGSTARGISYGPALADEIDIEWRRIVEECYALARRLVQEDSPRLDAVSQYLMSNETVLKDEWKQLMEHVPSRVNRESLVFDPMKSPPKDLLSKASAEKTDTSPQAQ